MPIRGRWRWLAGVSGLTVSAKSQGFEEGEELVGGPVSARGGRGRRGPVECLLLERHVGLQVNLRGDDRFVTEPQGDDGDVDPGVQQCRGGGVAQDGGVTFLLARDGQDRAAVAV
jgi:hypothetical protein